MMICKLCFKFNSDGTPVVVGEDGAPKKGLKQVSKTKRTDIAWKNKYGEFIQPGAAGERFYRCQDCGAFWRFTFNIVTKQSHEEPVFQVIQGGKSDG